MLRVTCLVGLFCSAIALSVQKSKLETTQVHKALNATEPKRSHKAETEEYALTHKFTLFRENTIRQIHDLKNERVVVFSPKDMDEKKHELLSLLPKNGAAVFVIDDPFASKCISVKPDLAFLDDPRVLVFASENYLGPDHPKVEVMPIGEESSLMHGKYGEAPLKKLIGLMEKRKEKREHKVVSDAQIHRYPKPRSGFRDDRKDMMVKVHDAVQEKVIDDYYEKFVGRSEHIERVANAEFALCPEGNGLDTHRFYENYALGTRCIVREGPLTELHQEFPGTVVVREWKEVNKENLEEWGKETYAFKPELLTSEYWISQVLAKAHIPVAANAFEYKKPH